MRHISPFNITLALKEISSEEYETTFEQLSEKCWNGLQEKNILKKRKKFCDYMLRRGYESFLVYDKVTFLEKEF
jgi:regulatory protein